MDYKFCCYGTYSKTHFKCLIKCPDKEQCEIQTNFNRLLKYKKQNEEKENAENNEGRILSEDC